MNLYKYYNNPKELYNYEKNYSDPKVMFKIYKTYTCTIRDFIERELGLEFETEVTAKFANLMQEFAGITISYDLSLFDAKRLKKYGFDFKQYQRLTQL